MIYNNPEIELKIVKINEVGICLMITGSFLFLMAQHQRKANIYDALFQTDYKEQLQDTTDINKYAITFICLGSFFLLYSSYLELLNELDVYEKTGNDANLNAAYNYLTANAFQFIGTAISLYTTFFIQSNIVEPTL